MKRIGVLLAASLTAMAVGGTFQGGSRVTFSDPTAAGPGWESFTTISNAGTHGVGSNSFFSSGDPVPGSFQNRLDTFGQDFDVDAETDFVVAGLQYYNGQTWAGTAATGVTGTASLFFTAPIIDGANPREFEYSFSFNLTVNSPGPVDDELTISLLGSPQVFTALGNTYTLTLLGFRLPDNSFTTTFLLPEDATATADLIGRITTNIPTIPLPTGAGLGMAGLMGLAFVRRR